MGRIMEKIQPYFNGYFSFTANQKQTVKSNVPLSNDLGANIKAIVKPLAADEFIIRLHNLNENSVSVSRNYFANLARRNGKYILEELNLSANQKRTVMIQKKLKWNGVENVYNPIHEDISSKNLLFSQLP